MRELRPYQIESINKLAQKASQGKKHLLFQLATGGGKTVSFAGLINRFINKQQKRVLILVHREELLKQAIRTIFEWYDIMGVPVTAGMTYLPNAIVYVAMVETAYNRLKKNPDYFGNIGLVIVDEAHLGNFKKLYEYYKDVLIIGFTATPLSASKKDPLKNHFEDIVCGIDIPDLIRNKSLVPNKTFHITNVNRKDLKIKNGEFDEREMGNVFSTTRHVQNCVKAYQEYALNTKTLVFNCNIDHSKKVTQAFQAFGYPCRHLDGESDDKLRKETIQWFKNTPNAILCNVGILTTGFDEPSVESIIMNKSTMSLPLWLQCCGRGSRPYAGKEYFTILDLGGNALTHDDWCASHDWEDMFFNPDKPKGGGEAPCKECISCHAVIHLSQKICPHCGADNYKAPKYDEPDLSVEQLSQRRPPYIDVALLIQEYTNKKKADGQPFKDLAVVHEIKRQIVNHAKRSWKIKRLDDASAKLLLKMYQDKVREWCTLKLKTFDWWIEKSTKEWIYSEFKRLWNYEPGTITEKVH